MGYFTLSILLTTFLTILKLLKISSINLIASTTTLSVTVPILEFSPRRGEARLSEMIPRLSERSLAWASLAELSAYAYVLYDWLMGVLDSPGYDVINISYVILGLKVDVRGMRLI